MPALSSTMTEGKIVSWLKSPGDKISKGESVVVVGAPLRRLRSRDPAFSRTPTHMHGRLMWTIAMLIG